MLRMNRQVPNTPRTLVKNHCANYDTGYICSGVMIHSDLRMSIDLKKQAKPCLVVNNKECDYYNNCVKPSIK